MNTYRPTLSVQDLAETIATLRFAVREAFGDREALARMVPRVRKLSIDMQRALDPDQIARKDVEQADRLLTASRLRLIAVESVRDVISIDQLAGAMQVVLAQGDELLALIDERQSDRAANTAPMVHVAP